MKALLFVFTLWLPWQAAIAAERILALAPHVCETLYAIGAQDDIVGAVSYCDYPSEALAIPRVGSYKKLNIEAALRLNPTMVIVMSRNMNGIDFLESRGVKVIESYPHDIDAVIHNVRRLGRATGHEKQANQVANGLALRLEKIRASKKESVPVFYEIWSKPLISPGHKSFISSLLHEAGAANIFDMVDLDTIRVSVEGVIQAKPRVVIIPTESRDVNERKVFWNRWLGDKTNVIFVKHDIMHRPGPRLLDGIEQLQTALQAAKHGE